MKLFGAYLKQRVKSILLMSGCAIIYFACFTMYHLPLRATIYPTILCVALDMIYLILDFKKVKQKIEVLQYMENVPEVLEEHLPSAGFRLAPQPFLPEYTLLPEAPLTASGSLPSENKR